ncbi:MAG: TolC family protein [Thermoanaerobaculia bacterium]
MKTFTGFWKALCFTAFAATALAQAPPPPTTSPRPLPAPEKPEVSVTVSARPSQRQEKSLPPAAEEGVAISLRDAIELALANNVDLRVAVAGEEQGRFGVLQAKGIYDPLVAAFGQVNDRQTPNATQLAGGTVTTSRVTDGNVSVSQLIPFGGTVSLGLNNEKLNTNSSFYNINPSYNVSDFLSLKQPLLRNFGVLATNRFILIAKYGRGIDDQSFLQSVQSTVTSVEQAYWDLVYARENLKVKVESRDLAVELNRITKIKIDVGSQAPIDIVQTESGVAARELDIITARAAVGDAEDRLKRLLNFAAANRWNDHVVPTDEVRVEPVKIDLEAGVAEALDNRPEVRSAKFTAATAKVNYDFSRNQLWPQLDLNASYGYAGLGGPNHLTDPATGLPTGVVVPGGYSDAFTQVTHRDFHNWLVGLNFSFPILNRAARGAKGFALWGLQSSLATLEQLEQNVTVGVRTAARAIETARQSIEAAGKARELAERNVDAEKKKYDNGLVTSFEVLSVQNDLATARSAELQALTQYRNAIVAYHQAIGDLLGWKDIKIEGLSGDAVPSVEGWKTTN